MDKSRRSLGTPSDLVISESDEFAGSFEEILGEIFKPQPKKIVLPMGHRERTGREVRSVLYGSFDLVPVRRQIFLCEFVNSRHISPNPC